MSEFYSEAEAREIIRQSVVDEKLIEEPSGAQVEAGAREAFFTDDAGGHIRGGHTWDTIPEVGRENYRTMVRAVLHAALRAAGEPSAEEPEQIPKHRTFPNPDDRYDDDGIGLLGGAPRW